jgi:hypothetical protein
MKKEAQHICGEELTNQKNQEFVESLFNSWDEEG